MICSDGSTRLVMRRHGTACWSKPRTFFDTFTYANRSPPTDQVRGHASLENALSPRPILGGNRRRIGADDLGQRVASGAQQCGRKVVLDILHQAKALVDQRG